MSICKHFLTKCRYNDRVCGLDRAKFESIKFGRPDDSL